MAAPFCQIVEKRADPRFYVTVKIIFDVKNEVTHIPSHDDPGGLQLSEVLSQDLFRGPWNFPRQLTQASGAGTHRAENFNSPLILK